MQAFALQGHEKGKNGRMLTMWAKGEEREGMDKKEDFEKCGGGVGLFEPNGFPMRWRPFLKCTRLAQKSKLIQNDLNVTM